jgi:hypothetical protein
MIAVQGRTFKPAWADVDREADGPVFIRHQRPYVRQLLRFLGGAIRR